MSSASNQPALFRVFPTLASKLPRCEFLSLPTPVEPFPLSAPINGDLWIKRDDQSCRFYGGNKPRKLEFAIGRALARKSRRLVTTGALGTNHGLATTILGRQAGLPTTLVLADQPINDKVRRTLFLHAAWGADIVHGGTFRNSAVQTIRTLLRSTLAGERPYLVPTGGSSPTGNVGFVSAGFELGEQIRSGECPKPDQVYTAVGTGGTLAGLVVGLRLAGLDARAVGVLVTDKLAPTSKSLARAATATARRMRRFDPAVPEVSVSTDDFELVTRQLGKGYGRTTAAADRAVAAAAKCGITLETTYTGKCLAEIRARADDGLLPPGPVLFWNTFNAIDAAANAPGPLDAENLPESIQNLLDSARA